MSGGLSKKEENKKNLRERERDVATKAQLKRECQKLWQKSEKSYGDAGDLRFHENTEKELLKSYYIIIISFFFLSLKSLINGQ